MFMKLKSFAGPKNYTFKDPDTGHTFNAPTRDALVKEIISYRLQNELPPIVHIQAVLENYWCGLPENQGSCESTKLRRGLFGYIQGGVVLLQNVFYGNKYIVEQEVADERSKQCKGCKFNSFPDKGPFIEWSDRLAEASLGSSKKSKYHDDLGNCDVCSCPLRAKVFYGGVVKIEKAQKEKYKEVNCWQLKLEG